MFKLFVLSSDFIAALDDLQTRFDVLAVSLFGSDSTNKYVLVQYGAKAVPGTNPVLSGSLANSASLRVNR